MYIVREKIKEVKKRLINHTKKIYKNWGANNLGKLLRILQNVIEKTFIKWRVLPLVKINTPLSDTPCIFSNLVSRF
jgi:hypothetical protein